MMFCHTLHTTIISQALGQIASKFHRRFKSCVCTTVTVIATVSLGACDQKKQKKLSPVFGENTDIFIINVVSVAKINSICSTVLTQITSATQAQNIALKYTAFACEEMRDKVEVNKCVMILDCVAWLRHWEERGHSRESSRDRWVCTTETSVCVQSLAHIPAACHTRTHTHHHHHHHHVNQPARPVLLRRQIGSQCEYTVALCINTLWPILAIQ